MSNPISSLTASAQVSHDDLPAIDQPFYKPSEVASLLQVDKSTIYRWIEQGALRAITLPTGTRRIPGPVLYRFLQGNSNVGAAISISPSEDLAAEFKTSTGMTTAEFIAGWKRGEIDKTDANEAALIKALGIRALS